MEQSTRDTSSAIIDGVIKFIAAGGLLTTALIAPNAVQIFDKPLGILLGNLNKRQQQRELRRILYYMKSRDLVQYSSRDYEHGILLTDKGKKRLQQASYEAISIPTPSKWDNRWRLVFYDIPENQKSRRNALNLKLKQLGFKQLQISIWVHPYQSRAEIEVVCEALKVREYVTYVEISHIDSEQLLRKRFKLSNK